MQTTLSELCQTLESHGMRPALCGSGDTVIRRIATIDEAEAGDIAFLSNPRYEKHLATTGASAVVVGRNVANTDHLACIRVDDPYAAITVLLVRLYGYRKHQRVFPAGQAAFVAPSARIGENALIYPGATIDDEASIGDNAVIYPGCYVGPRCRIGHQVLLYPNVVVYDECVLGDRVTIHAGSIIGEDGLGYAPVDGRWVKIPQIGIVEIGDDVEIGANCTIDRATLGRTRIASGTKFSNLIAIGHGTQIGEHCLFVAQVGVAGSVTVGNHVVMAGQVGVVGHIEIGDNATIGAKAGVTHSVPAGETYLGQPAMPIRDTKRRLAMVGKLPELNQAVKDHEKRLAELEARLNGTPGPA